MTKIFACTHCDVHIATDEDLHGNPCDHCPDGLGRLFLLKDELIVESNPSSNAFPIVLPEHIEPGLSKREYFAAMAMQALLSDGKTDIKFAVPLAVEAADALIQKLNKADDDT